MALTRIQRKNIQALDTDTVIEILHECVERLGLVSVKEYCEIHDRKPRVTYLDIQNEKIKSIKLSENIYCIINMT